MKSTSKLRNTQTKKDQRTFSDCVRVKNLFDQICNPIFLGGPIEI